MGHIIIKKSIVIQASKKVVWDNIVNFERQALWSPWLIIESDCTRTLAGPDGELGTIDRWEGSIIGTGERENTKIVQGEYIEQDLRFEKPWKSKAHTFLKIQQKSEEEFEVTWTLETKLPFFLFFMKSMFRRMIGEDYERGLKMLKVLSETGKLETSTQDMGIQEQTEVYWVGREHQAHMSEIAELMTGDFNAVFEFLTQQNIAPEEFRSYYPKIDMKNGIFHFLTVITLQQEDWDTLENLPEGIKKGTYQATKNYSLRHHGSYDFLPNTWTGVFMYLRAKKLKLNKAIPPCEVYINDPMNTPAEQLLTDVSVPIR
ncbi:SRPBCC family protein [Candidatus Gracilibacteria bacterium]|nr:SRPBCC family protein [Candidatus Gracilibacteria bacterium]